MIARGASTLAVCSVALLGASNARSEPAAPAAGPGYVVSIQFSYDSPPSPDTRHRVTVELTGEVCGDPLDNPWTFVGRRSGGPTAPAPTLSTVTFAAANPATITGDRWTDATGAEVGRIDFLLRLTQGTLPVLTAQWETSGDILNVAAAPPEATASRQTLPDCPSARPSPPPPTPRGTPTGGPAAGYPAGRIKLPGQTRYSRITRGQALVAGTSIDVSNGRGVALTDGRQGKLTISGQRDGVPSIVRLVRIGRVVELQLTRGNLEACGKPARRLWANGKGNFQVRGRYASVSKGRWWLTTDYCDRTVIQARTGSVLVRDLVTKKNVVVKAPNTYVAHRKR